MSYAVIIPHGKKNHRLLSSVRSCNQQTIRPNNVIIVCNNGISPIDAEFELRDFVETGFVVIDECKGISNANVARNRGAEIADVDWISFLDSDDTWDAEYAENVFSRINSDENIDFVYGSYKYTIANGDLKICRAANVCDYGNAYEYVMSGMSTSSCTMFVKKTLFLTTRWNNTLRRHQDFDYFVRLIEASKATAFVEAPLVNVDWIVRTKHKAHSDCIRVTRHWCRHVETKKYGRYLRSLLAGAVRSRDFAGIFAILTSIPTILVQVLSRIIASKHRDHK